MADQPVKESVALSQQTAESEIINLLGTLEKDQATGNEDTTPETPVEQSTKVESETQELTPDDLKPVHNYLHILGWSSII